MQHPLVVEALREAQRIRDDAEAYAAALVTSAQDIAEESMKAIERSVAEIAALDTRRLEVAQELAALEAKKRKKKKPRRTRR